MARYRLLAIDIDGTLVNSRHELTDATRAAILRAKRSGIEVVLASGRRYSRVLPLVEPLAVQVPLVTASGALIKHPLEHRTLFRAEFAPAVLPQLLRIITEAGYEAVLYGDTFSQGFDFYCIHERSDQFELAEFLALNAGFERVWPDLMKHPPDQVFAGFAIGEFNDMQWLKAELNRRLPQQLDLHVLRSPRYTGYFCEIVPYEVSKWSGICHLAEQWNISAAEICAVGDDVNDIPMIRAAGLGVAMGNALDEVKAAADRVAPSHDEDGLVEVVEWLLN